MVDGSEHLAAPIAIRANERGRRTEQSREFGE
jgi:hypothetical protein